MRGGQSERILERTWDEIVASQSVKLARLQDEVARVDAVLAKFGRAVESLGDRS